MSQPGSKPAGQQAGRPAGPALDLAVIIVNWNVRALLADCLATVRADLEASGLAGQVWVVDNASTDGSVEMLHRDFPWVRLLASDRNLGFAGGNNAALAGLGFGPEPGQPDAGLPEAVLLLNPDTRVHPGALAALVNFLRQRPEAGIAGARLVYGDGSFQHSAFAFPGLWQLAIDLLPWPARLTESRLNGRYPRARYECGRPFAIGHPLGAAMGVRREAIQQAGLLDQAYQMYVEEIDWSRRIVAAGWQAYCVPAAVVTHLGGQSTAQAPVPNFVHLWTSRYRFYRRYYHPLKLRLAAWLVTIGMRRRAAADSRAAGQGRLDPAQLAERLAAYETITRLWQGQPAKG